MREARYILAFVGALFLVLSLIKLARGTPFSHPSLRAWLLVALIFGAVSAWLSVH